MGTISIFNKIGIVKVEENEIADVIQKLKENQKKVAEDAKKLSLSFENKQPLIISAEFLKGNAHIIRNQVNETAKCFANFAYLPELNHHLMEGLKHPTNEITALFINSDLYSENLRKRFLLTKDVIKKNNLDVYEYKSNGNTKLLQAMETLFFGGFFSFYLALIYNENPSLIPWVDYFKQQLKK